MNAKEPLFTPCHLSACVFDRLLDFGHSLAIIVDLLDTIEVEFEEELDLVKKLASPFDKSRLWIRWLRWRRW